MKVLVHGDPQGQTGYSAHTRGLIKGLLANGFDVSVECPRPPMWDRNQDLDDELIECMRKDPERREVTIMVGQPPFWSSKLSDRPKRFYGFLVFEGDKIPKSWVQDINREDVTGVFVPSHHVRLAAEKSGVKRPIHVISHGVDVDLFKPKEPTGDISQLKDDNKCTFLFNKGWAYGENDRSGFDILVKAFNEEFKSDEPVRLIAHINKAYAPPGWDFGQEISKLKLKDPGPMLVYFDNQVPYKFLPDLYNCANFICSASKAEGFNLTVLEGMSCGNVPIVPDTGGEKDYVTEKEGYIYGNTGFQKAFGWPLYEGVQWLSPDKVALRRKLREAYDDWKIGVGGRKVSAREKAEGYTWKKTGQKIKNVLSA